MKNNKKTLSASQQKEMIQILEKRFQKNKHLHKTIEWKLVKSRLESNPEKLWSLNEMEISGGEPDVISFDKKSGEFAFVDCSEESPKGRRSICYDHEALEKRKEHKPADSAVNMAEEMGIELLNEEQYKILQSLGKFDLKTSSWIKTPVEIRKHGGAIFCDRRYEHVFTYHNGAESYYAARGFRGILNV